MTRYQLAKLVQWAGTFDSRKRLQKCVFLLQAAGCPLDAEYLLHPCGPYSEDVAGVTDELVQLGMLVESPILCDAGQRYSYALTPQARREIAKLERTDAGRKLSLRLGRFQKQAKALLKVDLDLLEIVATVAFFRHQGRSWPASVERTCTFMNLASNSGILAAAVTIAQAGCLRRPQNTVSAP